MTVNFFKHKDQEKCILVHPYDDDIVSRDEKIEKI